MNADEIKAKLTEGVADILGMDDSEVDTSAMLLEMGMDSLGLVETFVFIEKTFGHKLLETGITRQEMESIDALAAYMAGLKG